jgi:DNA polymerase IIIc chi subunit
MYASDAFLPHGFAVADVLAAEAPVLLQNDAYAQK